MVVYVVIVRNFIFLIQTVLIQQQNALSVLKYFLSFHAVL